MIYGAAALQTCCISKGFFVLFCFSSCSDSIAYLWTYILLEQFLTSLQVPVKRFQDGTMIRLETGNRERKLNKRVCQLTEVKKKGSEGS